MKPLNNWPMFWCRTQPLWKSKASSHTTQATPMHLVTAAIIAQKGTENETQLPFRICSWLNSWRTGGWWIGGCAWSRYSVCIVYTLHFQNVPNSCMATSWGQIPAVKIPRNQPFFRGHRGLIWTVKDVKLQDQMGWSWHNSNPNWLKSWC